MHAARRALVQAGGGGGGGGLSYPATVLADSPVGYWKLDETSGTTAADSSGNSHSGTYQGTYTLAQAGLVGNAVSLNAGAVSLPALTLSRPFSLELLVNPTGSTEMGGGATGFGSLFGENGSRRLLWSVSNQEILAQIPSNLFSVNGDTQSGSWSHVVYTNSTASSNNETLYVNGSQEAQQTNTSADWLATSWVGSHLALSGVVDYLLVGLVQHVAIYNTALSGTRVAAHYAAA